MWVLAVADLENFRPCGTPGIISLIGQYVRLEPLSSAHINDLAQHLCGPENADIWRYIPALQPADADALATFFAQARARDWLPMAIIAQEGPFSGQCLGHMAYMRLRADHGSVEVGAVLFGHALQRTRMASEALRLMAAHVFDDLGYRRFEWKCNNDNLASKAAAVRFGFQFEGVFRQDMVVRGHNRDTAWYSMLDHEWPKIKRAFAAWLRPDNFDDHGKQIAPLRV